MMYTTVQGDTWDLIAKKIYGNESYMDLLMSNNFEHLDTMIFPSGAVLNVPDKPVVKDRDLPSWRR